LGYFPNATHAQAVLGVHSGDLAKALAPSRLTTKTFNAGPSLIEALFGGEIDIGYVGPSPAMTAHVKSKGKGIRIVAGAAANGVLIVARKDSGINTLADLAGKRLATPQLGNTQDVSARHYLKTELKQADLKNVLPIANAEHAAMMARGQIDASWIPEPWGSVLLLDPAVGAKLIAEEKDLWPNKEFVLTLVVTTPQFLQKYPQVVQKLLTVHRSWTARLQADPTKYLPQLEAGLFAINGKKLPKGVLASAMGNVRFTDEPLEETLRTFADWAYDLEFAKQKPDLTGLVDAIILRKLQDSK
jgi:NitT/TauT family transport system substrate-binding protein